MPHAGTYVLVCLISGVSAALILASGPSYTESRSPQGTAYNVDGARSTYDGCQGGPCQIAHLNSVEEFCLWAPSHPATRNTEHTLTAWCTESIQGSRVIPDETILGAHLVITPEYVQITGVGKLTNINVPPDGVVSTSGQSYSDHQFVVTSVYGQLEQISEWTSFVSQERFCFRACRPSAAASAACPQIHDIFGCSEGVSGNYDTGVFEDCIVDAAEVPSALNQEILAAPSHRSALLSHCTSHGTIRNARIAHARRAIAPVLATSLSQSHLSPSHSTPVASCMAPTTTDTTAMPMTSSPFPTSTVNATSFMNFNVSSTNAPTFTMCPYNHTHTLTRSHHTHTHRRSHHHSSTFSATSSSSSSYHSFGHSPSASSLNDSSSMSLASSSSISSTPSFTVTSSTFYSRPLSGTATSFVTSASIPLPTPSLPSSSYGTPSALPGPPTPPSSYDSSISSVSSAASSSVPSISSSISSQTSYILTFTNPSLLSFPTTSSSTSDSSYVLTFTTPSLSSVPTTSPASSLSPVSPSMFSSPSSSTSSQTSSVLPFTTPSSSDPTASLASSSPTVPNSQTQIGSQCPPSWNAGSVSSIPLPPLTLAILMIVISSSIGIAVF